MVNMNELEWGLRPFLTREALAAYGARTIFKNGQMDFPHDRQSFLGEELHRTLLLREWINSKALPALRRHIQNQNWTPDTEETLTFENWPYVLTASPRGSYGYIYISSHMKGLDKFPEIDGVDIKWSGSFVPKIGDMVRCKVNNIGPGKVLGYYLEHKWVGIIVMPDAPPEWYVNQNGSNAPCGLFGVEFGRIDENNAKPPAQPADK